MIDCFEQNHNERDVLRALVVMQHYSPYLLLAIVVLESPASSANSQDTAHTSARPLRMPRHMSSPIMDASGSLRRLTRPPKHKLHPLHLLGHPQHHPTPRTRPRVPRVPRVSQSLLEMQVFVLLTPPTPSVPYNLMHMLTGMQTQVPHLI